MVLNEPEASKLVIICFFPPGTAKWYSKSICADFSSCPLPKENRCYEKSVRTDSIDLLLWFNHIYYGFHPTPLWFGDALHLYHYRMLQKIKTAKVYKHNKLRLYGQIAIKQLLVSLPDDNDNISTRVCIMTWKLNYYVFQHLGTEQIAL